MDRKPLRNQWVISPLAGLLAISLFTALFFQPHSALASRTRQITFGKDFRFYGSADWGVPYSLVLSPDGSRIAFNRQFASGDEAVVEWGVGFTIRADGKELYMPLGSNPPRGSLLFGNFSWDGSLLAINGLLDDSYQPHPAPSGRIYTIKYDGSNLTQLTSSGSNPFISADGNWIAFASSADFIGQNPDKDGEIYLVSSDGAEYRQITHNSVYDMAPTASADLGVIVFSRTVSKYVEQVFVTDAVGSFERQLTFGKTITRGWARVSGDGSLIVFSRSNPYGLYTIKPDGTGEKLISSGHGFASGKLSGDGSIMLKVENSKVYLGPSDGSAFKDLTAGSHNFWAWAYDAGDLDYSGHKAVFSMTTNAPSNESAIHGFEIFVYDDRIGDTPAGEKVVVPVDNDIRITFSSVTAPGQTSALISEAGLLPPANSGIFFGEPALHYELSTTASWTGNAEVCVGYGERLGLVIANEPIQLWRRDSGSWTNITSSDNRRKKMICGNADRLGEFVVAMQKRQDYFVSSEKGSDTNGDGTAKRPWATIKYALERTQPDAAAPLTIHVAGGVYREHFSMKKYASILGSYDAKWHRRSLENFPSILQGEGKDNWRAPDVLVYGSDNAVLDGFVIRDSIFGVHNSDASPTISNCRIENNRFGIFNDANSPEDMQTSPLIKNNVIAWNEYGIMSRMTALGVGLGDPWWPDVPTVLKPVVINNTIVNNNAGILEEVFHIPETSVKNNILWNNEYDVETYWTDVTYSDIKSGGTGNGNISADPMFVDVAAGNYRLLPGSPAIDAGDPDPQYNDPDGSRNDMGAYGGPAAMLTVVKVKLPNGIQIDDLPEAMPGGEYFAPTASNTGQGGCSYAGHSMNGMKLGDFLVYMALIIFPLFIMRSIRSVRRQARKIT